MRVITEERLLDLIADMNKLRHLAESDLAKHLHDQSIDALRAALRLIEDIDQLTVSKLRPIEELPLDEFLLKIKGKNGFREAIIRFGFDPELVESCGNKYSLDECEGWIPLPLYKPEQP